MSLRSRQSAPPSVLRRTCLKAGFLGFGGLRLADLLRSRASADNRPSELPSCLLIWLGGGPSHLDTYDLKPNVPAEYRGPYHPIPTNVPGFDICELMPRHARIADRLALIRSCHHEFNGHWDGNQHMLTGWPAVLTGGGTRTSVYPEIGTVVKKIRPQMPNGMPGYVAIGHRLESVGPAYLGSGYEPFVAAGQPHDPNFRVPNLELTTGAIDRLSDRRTLRAAFDQFRRTADQSSTLTAMDQFDLEALHLLTSTAAQRAFDLHSGDPRERDRYGRTHSGQTLYLARRLLEAGVGFVTVEIARYEGVDGGWDDHAGSCNIFERMDRRLPVYDQSVTALIEDLYDRGLDRRVLVVIGGEFGRTPQIHVRDNKPGREHHAAAMSLVVSGGGMRMGQVIGSTTARGETPKERPLRPVDLLATIYRFLQIDVRQEFRDYAGRPRPILPEGEPIHELLG